MFLLSTFIFFLHFSIGHISAIPRANQSQIDDLLLQEVGETVNDASRGQMAKGWIL